MNWYTNEDIPGDGPCQLVTALNALVYLGSPLPSKPVIEILVNAVACRYGSALCIEAGWRILGLHVERMHDVNPLGWIKNQLKRGHPVEIGGFSPDWGYHSSLCIGVKGQNVQLVNWEKNHTTSVVRWKDILIPECNKGPVAFYMHEHQLELNLYPR